MSSNSGRPSYSRAAAVNSTPKEEEVILLHIRLGYPSFTLLKIMCPHLFKGLSGDKLICDACQLAKSERKMYQSMESRSQAPFQLIHCDVWGPSPHTDMCPHTQQEVSDGS